MSFFLREKRGFNFFHVLMKKIQVREFSFFFEE